MRKGLQNRFLPKEHPFHSFFKLWNSIKAPCRLLILIYIYKHTALIIYCCPLLLLVLFSGILCKKNMWNFIFFSHEIILTILCDVFPILSWCNIFVSVSPNSDIVQVSHVSMAPTSPPRHCDRALFYLHSCFPIYMRHLKKLSSRQELSLFLRQMIHSHRQVPYLIFRNKGMT